MESSEQPWERVYKQARTASFKRGASNPLANPMLKTVIKGALKGLKMVAMVSLAYEVAIAAQMLERFIDDRQRDLDDEKQPEIGFH